MRKISAPLIAGMTLLAWGACKDEGVLYLTNVNEEPVGANCADGGNKLNFGADSDADGQLSAAEVTASAYVCNGAASRGATVTSSAIQPGDSDCPEGGFLLSVGVDRNGNGAVDVSEGGTTRKICNGATGSEGAVGTSGGEGPVGGLGSTGAPGSDGATGPQGPFGFTGATGTSGPQGAPGFDGVTGPQGDEGIQGVTGPQGDEGIQGVTGPQGDQGIQGLQGDAGLDGVTGPQGDEGIQGVTGPQGDEGIQGVTGPQGDEGIQGVTGPQGDEGIQGVTGPQGLTGPQGVTGPSGPAGATGATGASGPSGPAGATGATGASGPAGATGATGASGPSGPAGATGATGASGPSGPAGATGATGPTGPTGEGGGCPSETRTESHFSTTWNTNQFGFGFNDNFGCTCGNQPSYFLGYTAPVTGTYRFNATALAGGNEVEMDFYNGSCIQAPLSTCNEGFPSVSRDQSLSAGQTITVVISPVCNSSNESGSLTVDLLE
jgi:hypothetical protein